MSGRPRAGTIADAGANQFAFREAPFEAVSLPPMPPVPDKVASGPMNVTPTRLKEVLVIEDRWNAALSSDPAAADKLQAESRRLQQEYTREVATYDDSVGLEAQALTAFAPHHRKESHEQLRVRDARAGRPLRP